MVRGRLRRLRGGDALAAAATSRGRRVVVRGDAIVRNAGRLEIGDDVLLVSQPVRSHLVVGPGASLRIADGVRIGHGAAISCAAGIDIGGGATLGSYVTIMDSDFHVAGDSSIAPTPVPVRIGRRAVIGHHVVVLPGAEIGERSVVAAGSVVSGIITAGTEVAGNPALPIDRSGAPDTGASVGEVVASVFHLADVARPDLRPVDVPEWDSLGALRLLLALESTFGVTIDEHHLAGVERVGDLQRLISSAARRPADR